MIPDNVYFSRTFKTQEEKPLVLIHPSFPLNAYAQVFDPKTGLYRTANYGANVRNAVKGHRGIVIALESPVKMNTTRQLIESLTGYDNFYILTESEMTSRPLEIDWAAATKFIKAKSKRFGYRVKMAGGNLTVHNGEYSGCLGSAYNELVKAGISPELLDGSCFTHSMH